MAVDQMGSDKEKVLIAIPTEGNIPSAAYDNHCEFFLSLGRREKDLSFRVSIGTVGGVFTPLARERIMDAAVSDGFDRVFMFDDDMILPMDALEKLMRHPVDLVAALAFMRRPPYKPVIFSQRSGVDPANNQRWFATHSVMNYPKGRLMECDAVGFGAVLIRTDLARKMKKPWFMSTCGTGEDVLFCFKAREEAGSKVFCDTSVKVGHLASRTQVIDEAAYESFNSVDRLREVTGDWSVEKKESCLVA